MQPSKQQIHKCNSSSSFLQPFLSVCFLFPVTLLSLASCLNHNNNRYFFPSRDSGVIVVMTMLTNPGDDNSSFLVFVCYWLILCVWYYYNDMVFLVHMHIHTLNEPIFDLLLIDTYWYYAWLISLIVIWFDVVIRNNGHEGMHVRRIISMWSVIRRVIRRLKSIIYNFTDLKFDLYFGVDVPMTNCTMGWDKLCVIIKLCSIFSVELIFLTSCSKVKLVSLIYYYWLSKIKKEWSNT